MFEQTQKQIENPSITVLVPICNVEKYLAECLDSLLKQTFNDFEVLCINDGSTDGSREIIQHYLDCDRRFKVIDKSNSGYGSSMNLGIDKASGKYIAILESDDFFEPDALAKLYWAAETVQADIVKANYWFYWSKPEQKNNPITVVKPEMAGYVFKPSEKPDILLGLPSIWTCLYNREFLNKNNIRFLETPGASFQDMGFDFKTWVAADRAYLIEDRILHYRQDNEQSSVNNPAKVFCVCDEFAEIERYIAEFFKAKTINETDSGDTTCNNKSANGDKKSSDGRTLSTENKAILMRVEKYLFRKRYDSYMWNFGRLTPELRKEFLPCMVEDLRAGMQEGNYDLSIFGSWQVANLEYLVKNPEKFLKRFPVDATPAAKAKYYFSIGGPKAVLDAMRH